MKKAGFLFSIFIVGFMLSAFSQDPPFKVYEREGIYIGEWDHDEIEITRKRPSKSKIRRSRKKLEKYTRLKWHVHKVYPYAVKLSELLEEVNAELAALPDTLSRRQYIKQKEDNLFGQYEQDIRRMTRTQGKILIKLIHRQTGSSMYYLIRDVKSGATAVFWQSIGRIFGIDLKGEFEDGDYEDDLIRGFVEELEAGGYNIVYKCHNYELK